MDADPTSAKEPVDERTHQSFRLALHPRPASQTSPLLGQARTAIGSINLSGVVMAASIRTGFILIDGNQLVFKTTYEMSGGNNYVVHTMRLLPNEKAIAGLSNVGGFRQAGQARYKCRNLSQ